MLHGCILQARAVCVIHSPSLPPSLSLPLVYLAGVSVGCIFSDISLFFEREFPVVAVAAFERVNGGVPETVGVCDCETLSGLLGIETSARLL